MVKILLLLVLLVNSSVEDSTKRFSEKQVRELELDKTNFFKVCKYYEIKFPEIVYAQARLESGNFTSRQFKKKNNFLGLYDSRNNRYMSFVHWTDCLLAYRDKVQYRYRGDSTDREEYLSWLRRIGYATDKNYISKIKKMI